MEINIASGEQEYIPEWNNNKNDAKPVKFILKFLTTGDKADCFNTFWDARGKMQIMTDNKLLLQRGCVRIENLRFNGQDVKTVYEFLQTNGLDNLLIEVATVILEMNRSIDTKN